MIETAPLTLPQVVQRLKKARKSGGQWSACCPAHDDHNPSMTVREGEGGKILFKCQKGCTFDQIAAAMGLPQSALMGAAAAETNGKARASAGIGPKPASEDYDYQDAEGNVVFRVTRYYREGEDDAGHPVWRKSFVQKRATPDGFKPGMQGVERLPYNLPAVLAARAVGQPVYVVEGEKDVHTLRQWGLVGTCNPGGAGKWAPEFGRHLHGADVVILPDNDDPGRSHAVDVATSASRDAASVSVVELPGIPERGDVTDWARLGNTASDLAALVSAAQAKGRGDVEIPAYIEQRALINCQPIEARALDGLPGILRTVAGHFADPMEKTVAVSSAVAVLSGLMPHVRVSHYDGALGLHQMFCLVARSGGGKAVMDKVAQIGLGVHKSRKEDGERAQQLWEYNYSTVGNGKGAKADREALGPRPFDRMYFIPANASKSFILRAAEAAGETACIVETEIDTLIGANDQEWGDFTDFVRKAFHHEAYRQGRIGNGSGETLEIERPSLALAISGTWGQFARLYGGPNLDNGFFNRFAFVVSNAARRYRSQRPTPSTIARDDGLRAISGHVAELHDVLDGRTRDLTITLPDEGWDAIDEAFGPLYDELGESSNRDRLTALLQRTVVMTARLAALLTVLRAWEQNYRVGDDAMRVIPAHVYDCRLAVHVGAVWFQHGRALLANLAPETEPTSPLIGLNDAARALYDALPDTFKRADADTAAELREIAPRMVKQYLADFKKAGLVSLDGHTYTKAPVDPVAPFLPEGAHS